MTVPQISSSSQRLFSAVPICFTYVFLVVMSCFGSEDANSDVNDAKLGSTGTVDENNADKDDCDEWSEDLVNDTILTIELIKVLQELPADIINMLSKEVSNSTSQKPSPEEKPTRTKRGIQGIWKKIKQTVQDKILEEVLKFVHQKQHNRECYDGVGCFRRGERMAVDVGGPASPDTIGTKITLYEDPSKPGREVTHDSWAKIFEEKRVDLSVPLFGIIHGFTSDYDMSWMHTMKKALFELFQGKCIVLLVEWIKGAKFPRYAAAAANSPMPGTLLSKLLIEMHKPHLGNLSPELVHLIGFSLGAHAVGFSARHYHKFTGKQLGRITGLDPAGPLFEGTNVSLSSQDAVFVDVIHTHSGTLQEHKLGIKESIGHVDFYPNGGLSQPGCESMFKIGCSHKRARYYFIESLTRTRCHFRSVNCDDGFKNYDKCKLTRNVSLIGEMGYNSKSKDGRGNQYLSTKSEAPFCIPLNG